MNERQKVFAEIYAACPNAAEAARRAGYSERTARQTGQRLLTKDDIAEYIRQLQNEATDARISTVTDVKIFWSEVMNDEDEKTVTRLKASELLARASGMFLVQDDKGADVVDDVLIYLPEIDGEELS
ncbi:MAG: terminase small subunit [Lachnospiraceae bacterium]|nr:terminase small subunit [Lachnospiraceae bacterium]